MKVIVYLCTNINCKLEQWLQFKYLNLSDGDFEDEKQSILCCPRCGKTEFKCKIAENTKYRKGIEE
jgi:hypothetical protein